MGNDDSEEATMEYSDIYVRRIRKLCKERHIAINKLATMNDAGKLLSKMYSKYWEPGYPDKRVATNDTLALFALVYPKMFKAERVSVSVNTSDAPGKTLIDFDGKGNTLFATDVDRKAFLSLLVSDLKKLDSIKLDI